MHLHTYYVPSTRFRRGTYVHFAGYPVQYDQEHFFDRHHPACRGGNLIEVKNKWFDRNTKHSSPTCASTSLAKSWVLSEDNRRFYVDASLTKGNCGTLAMDLFETPNSMACTSVLPTVGGMRSFRRLNPILCCIGSSMHYHTLLSNKVAEVTEYLQVILPMIQQHSTSLLQ